MRANNQLLREGKGREGRRGAGCDGRGGGGSKFTERILKEKKIRNVMCALLTFSNWMKISKLVNFFNL